MESLIGHIEIHDPYLVKLYRVYFINLLCVVSERLILYLLGFILPSGAAALYSLAASLGNCTWTAMEIGVPSSFDDVYLWFVFKLQNRGVFSMMSFDLEPRDFGDHHGPDRNDLILKKENNGVFSGSFMPPATMIYDHVDKMSMEIPVMGIIKMMICVLLSMKRTSLQEISGSSTSMMEEKTMDIKDIFARHGSRPCPLSIAEAKQLKGDSDELWDRVASQSGAVAGDDGGGSVLCMPLCAGQIQQNVNLISSEATEA